MALKLSTATKAGSSLSTRWIICASASSRPPALRAEPRSAKTTRSSIRRASKNEKSCM